MFFLILNQNFLLDVFPDFDFALQDLVPFVFIEEDTLPDRKNSENGGSFCTEHL